MILFDVRCQYVALLLSYIYLQNIYLYIFTNICVAWYRSLVLLIFKCEILCSMTITMTMTINDCILFNINIIQCNDSILTILWFMVYIHINYNVGRPQWKLSFGQILLINILVSYSAHYWDTVFGIYLHINGRALKYCC